MGLNSGDIAGQLTYIPGDIAPVFYLLIKQLTHSFNPMHHTVFFLKSKNVIVRLCLNIKHKMQPQHLAINEQCSFMLSCIQPGCHVGAVVSVAGSILRLGYYHCVEFLFMFTSSSCGFCPTSQKHASRLWLYIAPRCRWWNSSPLKVHSYLMPCVPEIHHGPDEEFIVN